MEERDWGRGLAYLSTWVILMEFAEFSLAQLDFWYCWLDDETEKKRGKEIIWSLLQVKLILCVKILVIKSVSFGEKELILCM